jgi:uncharacterized protein YqhQ
LAAPKARADGFFYPMDTIGGQAVIEGVMMKSRRGWTVAVRDPKGEIHVKRERLSELPGIFRMPLIRGVLVLFHTLVLGIKALEFSASKAYEDKDEKPLSRKAIAATIGFSLLLGIGLFIALPLYATKLIGLALGTVAKSSLAFNLVDGLIRVAVFLLYILIIGLWSEIRRVFEYHGAEHKVIHAFEHGRLDEADSPEFSPLHPRCGTSFLLIVMIVSILVFSFIPQPWGFAAKFLSRVVLIPLIAGISYEALKLSSRISGTAVGRAIVFPGLMLQRLTTREPDASQVQVALRALSEVLAFEEEKANA